MKNCVHLLLYHSLVNLCIRWSRIQLHAVQCRNSSQNAPELAIYTPKRKNFLGRGCAPSSPDPSLRRLDLLPQLQTTSESDAPGAPGLPPAKSGPVVHWKVLKGQSGPSPAVLQNLSELCLLATTEGPALRVHYGPSGKHTVNIWFCRSMLA